MTDTFLWIVQVLPSLLLGSVWNCVMLDVKSLVDIPSDMTSVTPRSPSPQSGFTTGACSPSAIAVEIDDINWRLGLQVEQGMHVCWESVQLDGTKDI